MAFAAHALAAVAAVVGARSGVTMPNGSLTATRPVDRVLGPGFSAEVHVGASIGPVVMPYLFVERTWFGCGRFACDATSWMFGGALRLQTPHRRGRAFVETGAGYRTMKAESIAGTSASGFLGTSAGLSFFQPPPSRRFNLSGFDVRLALGTTLSITDLVAIEVVAHLSVGRFARWTSVPATNLDPNASLLNEEAGATHAFYGLALGVLFGRR
jgi:hypothetical protein